MCIIFYGIIWTTPEKHDVYVLFLKTIRKIHCPANHVNAEIIPRMVGDIIPDLISNIIKKETY